MDQSYQTSHAQTEISRFVSKKTFISAVTKSEVLIIKVKLKGSQLKTPPIWLGLKETTNNSKTKIKGFVLGGGLLLGVGAVFLKLGLGGDF